jgi:multiple sugar transport system permease protein
MTLLTRGQRRTVGMVLLYGVLLVGVFVVILPILYTVSLSFRFNEDVLITPPRLLPPRFTLSAYPGIVGAVDVLGYIRNTAVVAAGTTACSVTLAALAAYTFARIRFRFANQLMVFLLLSQMFPGASIIVPLFQVLRRLGLYDTHGGLVFVFTGFTIPFCTWMLYGYFRTIPHELEEAAWIDGASRLQTLVRVILPLTLPGIAATAVFVMLAAWNDFTFAVLFIQSDTKRLITPGLTLFVGQYRAALNTMAAAAIIASIPPIVAFALVRRYFISGLVAGALKG